MSTLDDKFLNYETRAIFPEDPEELKKVLPNHLWYKWNKEQRMETNKRENIPAYHYYAPDGFLNDGTGFCKWKGKYHLFYGSRPLRSDSSRSNSYVWGHIVSDDMIHWLDLPHAIVNGPEPDTWTGAVYPEEDRVIAVYRAWGNGKDLGIGLAISTDPMLVNWEKQPGPEGDYLVIHSNPEISGVHTGDVCIWKKEGIYYILSGKIWIHPRNGETFRQGYLYRSTDLVHWEYMHPFIENDLSNPLSDDLACPTFWPLGDRHLLIHFSHRYGGRYLIGDYEQQEDKFYPVASGGFTNGSSLDGGAGPTTSLSDDGDVIMINELTYPREGKTWFPPVFSLPRRIGLTGKCKDEITISPAGDYQSLREENHHLENLYLPCGKETILDGFYGNQCEMEMTFSTEDSLTLELRVLRSNNSEEYTSIFFYEQRGPLYRLEVGNKEAHDARMSVLGINTEYSTLDNNVLLRAPEQASWFKFPDELLKLHIFIDHNILEVFANDCVCLCARPLPSLPDSRGVSVIARGSDAKLQQADFWNLRRVEFTEYPSV